MIAPAIASRFLHPEAILGVAEVGPDCWMTPKAPTA